MQPVKIRINQLGRVHDSEFEVLPVMIFSGESGLGKSYLAMLSHYIFAALIDAERINGFFKDKGYSYAELSKGFKNSGTALSFSKREFEEWMSKDAVAYLAYMLQHKGLSASIEISLPESVPDIIKIDFREEILGLVEHDEVYRILSTGDLKYRVKSDDTFGESPFAVLFRFYLINQIFGDFQKLSADFLFPPSRGPFLAYKQNPVLWPGMYGEFIKSLDLLSSVPKFQGEGTLLVNGLIAEILEGSVSRDGDTINYYTNGVQMPITAAAASVKEIAPFQWLAKFVGVENSAVLVEEPEAHLHPIKQRMMADILSSLCHMGTYMQITTHSDYFIERMNELLSFGTLYNNTTDPSSLEEISHKTGVISDMTVNPSTIGAYLLVKNQDGSSRAVRMDMEDNNKIPFTSFSETARKSIDNRMTFETYMNNESE